MLNESNLIDALSRIHGFTPQLADAEILPWGAESLLATTDSFSEREDFLFGLSPEDIGRIVAYGACTDVLACGAKPEAILQVWTCDAMHGEEFCERAAAGVESVAAHYGARVVGGDIAIAEAWSWTGTVLARAVRPVRRVVSARVPFDLYASDPLGASNAAVACGRLLPVPAFRDPVPDDALFATDTSGGLFDALENFRRVNHGIRIELDADIAVAEEVRRALPPGVEPGWTLVGGVGEYALLYAVPRGRDVADAVKIGEGDFAGADESEIAIRAGGRVGLWREPPPDWRAVPEGERLATVSAVWERIFAEVC